jgi:protein-tyrosine kinase
MSRIYKALKKAELEQSSFSRVDIATSLPKPQVREEINPEKIPAAVAVPILTQPKVLTAEQPHDLGFDDLQRHCIHQWHPDPDINIFNPGLRVKGAEQFRTLRSRLYQLRGNQQFKVLLITSAMSGEGKTVVAGNLAHALVRQADRRVLIIDTDLRRSQLHLFLGAQAAPGLTDYLRGEADERAIIQYSREQNLCFIPGGNDIPNPSELLSNGRLKTLLDRVRPLFEWVIVDSTPHLPVADASIVADYCDALLLVVRAGTTPSALVQKTCQELQGRKIVGVVLNAVEEDALTYGYYYSSHGNDYVKTLSS